MARVAAVAIRQSLQRQPRSSATPKHEARPIVHWKLKAAAFRVLDRVPFGTQAHFLSQRYLTRTWPRPRHWLTPFLGVATDVLDAFAQHGLTDAASATFLEIGAGRDLAVPIALRLSGAGRVIAVDIQRIARLDLINHAAAVIADELGHEAPKFSSWADLEAFGIVYSAPHDLVRRPPGEPIDAFISNEVLEHIPPAALQEVLIVARSALKPGGLSIHSIDYSDHYARDGGVSRYNFLRYPDADWARYNSGLNYVNRLRHSDYVAMHENAGLALIDVQTYSEPIPEEIRSSLATEFAGYDYDDLRTMRARIISKRC